MCAYVDRSVTKGKAPIVTVSTNDGTATVADNDYYATSTTVTFSKKSSQGYACVTVRVDGVPGESDETFGLTLSNPSAKWTLGTQSTATVTIHEMAVPNAPTDLSANLDYNSSGDPYVALTWEPPAGSYVATYLVSRSTTSGGPYTALGTVTGISYDVTPPPSVGTYYVVQMLNADNGTSAYSNEAFAPGFLPGHGLYWAENWDGRIKTANLDGSGMHTLVADAGFPLGMAVDSSHVYWTNATAIMESNLDGTNVTTLVSGLSNVYGLAVDANYVYWTELNAGTIMRADLNGSNVTTLVSDEFDPSSVAVAGGHIFWTNWLTMGGTVKEADLNGANVTTLVSGQVLPFAVAADSTYVYWVNQGEINNATGTVDRALLSDPSQVTTLASNQWHPDGLAVDASYIYWANSQAATINRANLNGSNATILVSGTSQPAGVAVAKS